VVSRECSAGAGGIAAGRRTAVEATTTAAIAQRFTSAEVLNMNLTPNQ